ncbi:MAG: PadR family transcriptional regulator [Eubacteriales bacterium]|nr:PadR family transcriptional regulator [Eubacteriales bacterium]
MEDKFLQQLKKGVLELLVLRLICDSPSYGYELQKRLKEESGGLFQLKEGTLYPILYRLEDDGLIESGWQQGKGRAAPKKIYSATQKGRAENLRRHALWQTFSETVSQFLEEKNHG